MYYEKDDIKYELLVTNYWNNTWHMNTWMASIYREGKHIKSFPEIFSDLEEAYQFLRKWIDNE